MGKMRGAYRVLVGTPERRRQLGRPRRKWGKKILKSIFGKGDGGMEWLDLAQDRDRWRAVVNAVMNFRIL